MMGALDAGRFAVRNLLDSKSRILLLQTFQKPKNAQSQLPDLSPMLKKISMDELDALKNTLIKEFDLSADCIISESIEEQLSTVLNIDFKDKADHSIVIGLGQRRSERNFPCRNVLKAVLNSGIRPAIIISNDITLIESKNIILYSSDKNEINQEYRDFLDEIKNRQMLDLEIRTIRNAQNPAPSSETTRHFNLINGTEHRGISESERLLRNELKQLESK